MGAEGKAALNRAEPPPSSSPEPAPASARAGSEHDGGGVLKDNGPLSCPGIVAVLSRQLSVPLLIFAGRRGDHMHRFEGQFVDVMSHPETQNVYERRRG